MSLLTDASLNNFKLTKFGNTVVNRSIFKYGGGSAYFDGSGDYLELPLNSAFDFGSGDFTIELWVYSTISSFQTLVARWGNGGNAFFLGMDTNTGNIQLYLNNAAAVFGGNPTINQWYHIAAVRNGSDVKLFLNGSQVGSTYNIGNAAINSSTEKLRIADDNNSGNPAFGGYIDELRITKGVARYTSNFTPPTAQLPNNSAEDPHFNNVSLLLNFNPIVDSSTNNFDPTEVGHSKVDLAVKKFGNGAGYFDGTGDYLQTINSDAFNFAGGPFTIEMWVNPNPTQISFGGANGNAGAFVSTRISAVHSPLEFSIRTDLKMQVLIESSGGGSWQAILVSNTALIANTWSHIALIYDGLVTRLFINGVLDDNFTNNNFSYRNISNTLYIGSGGDGNFNGYIDDLRITKGVARYVGFIPPQQELPDNEAGTSLLLHLNNPFTDASQNNFTITPFGDATTSTSVVKYRSTSAQFDGNGDHLRLPGSTALAMETGNYTIETWAYLNSLAQFTFIDSNPAGTSGTRSNGFCWYWNPSGGQVAFFANGTNYIFQVYSLPTNQWFHAALVRNNGITTIYINGTSIGSTNASYNATAATGGSLIGTFCDSLSLSPNGYFDDFRITKGVARYTSNFTPPTAELPTTTDPHFSNVSLLLRTSRNFVDSSPNNFTVTRFGNVQISPSIKRLGSGAAFFDGSGDYLSIPDNDVFNFGTGSFTVEAWVYLNSIPLDFFIISGNSNGAFFFGFRGGSGNNKIGWGRSALAWDYEVASGVTTGQWYHVAVVRSGTQMMLFVNGNQVGTTQTNSTSYNLGAGNVSVGAQNNQYFLNGYIDDLRVTKGIARYVLNFTPPTAELPDPSDPQLENVSLLLKADGTNGSTVFRDMSKNNHVLTTFGNTNINTSVRKFGTGSAFFDGTGDYLILSENNSFAFGTGDFTIEFWAYPLAFSSNNIYESRGSTEDTLTNRPTIYATANTFRFYAGADRITSNGGKATGQWYHIAVCRNSGITRMFINGIKEGVDYTDTNDYGIGLNRPMIGGFKETQGDGWFNGYIDELRVTKGVARYTSNFVPHTAPFRSYLLTPFSTSTLSENLLAFWKLSDLKDSSNNRNTLANISSVQFVSGKVGNCAQFNGTNTLTSNSLTPAFNAGQSFSVAFWANPTSNVLGTVVGAQGGNTLNIHNNGDGSMSFNNAASGDVSIAGAFQVGVWKHYVCIVSGGRNKVYINGVLVYNQPSGVTYSATSTTIGIGRYPGGTTLPFQGLIDSVGIWQKELTQSEVNELYNSGNGLEP